MSAAKQLAPEDERAVRERLLTLLREQHRRAEQRHYDRLFPDATATYGGATYHARSLYQRHMEHFRAGATHRERLFRAANRVGKTTAGAYEVTAHVTGLYRPWWEGKTFDRPNHWWVAGKNGETTRDIVQYELFGDVLTQDGRRGFSGTGMVPGDLVGTIKWKDTTPDLADSVQVRHRSGGWSTIGLKAYAQGRGSFEGTGKDGIWFDEEPPLDVYGEALIRLMTTGGILITTFTPLEGMSNVVKQFLPPHERPPE